MGLGVYLIACFVLQAKTYASQDIYSVIFGAAEHETIKYGPALVECGPHSTLRWCYNSPRGCHLEADNKEPVCDCHPYFTGKHCELVDMKMAEHTVTGTEASFTWPTPIVLGNYSVVYYDKLEPSAFNYSLFGKGELGTFSVDGLQPENREYVLCVIHKRHLEGRNSTTQFGGLLDQHMAYCGTVITAFHGLGFHSLLLHGICIVVTLLFMLLFFIQLLIMCCIRAIKTRAASKHGKLTNRDSVKYAEVDC